MSNLMKHRWYELRHQPIFWLTLAICYAFALFLIGTVGEHYMTDSPMVAGAAHDWMGLFMNAAADSILPLIMISGAFTAAILGQQFSSRTVGLEISAGHSRFEIFASQSIAGFAVINLTVLPAILLGCLCWAGRVPMPSAAVVIPYLIRVFLLLLLLDFSAFSACILFLVIFRDTAKTMAVSALFLLIATWIMPALEQPLAKAPGAIYPLAPTLPLLLHPAFLMRFVLYSTLTPLQGLWSAGVAAGWSAFFLVIAYCVFRKCELK
jgi:ABC-2 type transport system permease protein